MNEEYRALQEHQLVAAAAEFPGATVEKFVVQTWSELNQRWMDGPSEQYTDEQDAHERRDEISGWSHVSRTRIVQRTVVVSEREVPAPVPAPAPPPARDVVTVYFQHDVLTPGNIRATWHNHPADRVPAEGDVVTLPGAGSQGGPGQWRVVRRQDLGAAPAMVLHMTDAMPVAERGRATQLDEPC